MNQSSEGASCSMAPSRSLAVSMRIHLEFIVTGADERIRQSTCHLSNLGAIGSRTGAERIEVRGEKLGGGGGGRDAWNFMSTDVFSSPFRSSPICFDSSYEGGGGLEYVFCESLSDL